MCLCIAILQYKLSDTYLVMNFQIILSILTIMYVSITVLTDIM